MQATSIIPAARHYSYEGEFDMVSMLLSAFLLLSLRCCYPGQS